MPDILQGLLVGLTAFVRAQNIQRHVTWEQPHEQKNQRHCPQQGGNGPQDATEDIARHSSHTLATQAPHLLKLTKVVHSGTLQRWPLFDTVPIRHGRFPVKSTVTRDVLQEQALHLARDLGALLDLKRPALLRKELIKLRVAVFAIVERGIARKAQKIEQYTHRMRVHLWECVEGSESSLSESYRWVDLRCDGMGDCYIWRYDFADLPFFGILDWRMRP